MSRKVLIGGGSGFPRPHHLSAALPSLLQGSTSFSTVPSYYFSNYCSSSSSSSSASSSPSSSSSSSSSFSSSPSPVLFPSCTLCSTPRPSHSLLGCSAPLTLIRRASTVSLGDPEINPYYWGLKHLGQRKFFDLSDSSVSRNGRAPRLYFRPNLEKTKDIWGRDGYLLTIDNKAVLSSGLRMPFIIPSLELAQAICIEWAAQGRTIEYHAMPLTTLAGLAIDSTSFNRTMVMDELMENVELDTVLQRRPTSKKSRKENPQLGQGSDQEDKGSAVTARVNQLMTGMGSQDSSPNALSLSGDYTWMSRVENKKLHELEEQYHQPIIDWFNEKYGLSLQAGAFMQVSQRPEDLLRIHELHEVADDWTLAGLVRLGSILKSSMIPWALYQGGVSVEDAFSAARVEDQSLEMGITQGVHGNATDLSGDMMMIKATKAFWTLLGEQPPYQPPKPGMKPTKVQTRFAM